MEPRTVLKEKMEVEICRLKEELVRINYDASNKFPFKDYLAYFEKFISSSAHIIPATEKSYASPSKKVTVETIAKRALKPFFKFFRRRRISRRRRDWFNAILSSYDPAVLSRYNKLVLAFMMRNALDILPEKRFPEEVVDLYYKWFFRVLDDFYKRSDEYYSVNQIPFCIDVSICCLQSIPAGGPWIVHKSRIGLWFLITTNPWQFLECLYFIIRKTGGFSPFYIIHTSSKYLNLFRPEEMDTAYIRIAELMKLDSDVRGIIRASWLLDPNLEDISPNLAFLRKIPQANGAMLFRRVTTNWDINLALSMSSARRKLYKEGKYQPASYAYIWPRKEMLEWAGGHTHFH